MDIIKVLKEAVPNVNKSTLDFVVDVGDKLMNGCDQELEDLLIKHLNPLGVPTEAEVALIFLEVGKVLGKQQAVKDQKIFIQGDY